MGNSLTENLREIRENVRLAAEKVGKRPEDIRLMAVTKTVPAERVNEAIRQGVDLLGENRAQELNDKFDAYEKVGVDIHFIGTIQTNKLKYIVPKVSMVESVSSLSIAKEIERLAAKYDKVMDILVQVNVGNEETKSGFAVEELGDVLTEMAAMPHLRVMGLMAIPPFSPEKEASRPYFAQMAKLFIDIAAKKIDNINMVYLSMGMSHDYDVAIEEGANIVRIGSAMFGARK